MISLFQDIRVPLLIKMNKGGRSRFTWLSRPSRCRRCYHSTSSDTRKHYNRSHHTHTHTYTHTHLDTLTLVYTPQDSSVSITMTTMPNIPKMRA